MSNTVAESLPAPLYSLVDIGANLTNDKLFVKLDKVLENSRGAGLKRIMVTGGCEKSTDGGAELVAKHPDILRYTAGVHPHDAKDYQKEGSLAFITSHASRPGCVAIGECGLDFNRNYSSHEDQEAVFEKQLKLACDLQKPLFLHERDASEKMVEMLLRCGDRLPPAVIHCFTGSVDEAKRYIEMGLFIGITGYVTKNEAEGGVRLALRDGVIPLDRLLLETDAPYMYPKINKLLAASLGKTLSEQTRAYHSLTSYACNEPCSLPAICEVIAMLMGKSASDVAQQTTDNAFTLYGL